MLGQWFNWFKCTVASILRHLGRATHKFLNNKSVNSVTNAVVPQKSYFCCILTCGFNNIIVIKNNHIYKYIILPHEIIIIILVGSG